MPMLVRFDWPPEMPRAMALPMAVSLQQVAASVVEAWRVQVCVADCQWQGSQCHARLHAGQVGVIRLL
jgi:hypothetical protein